MSKSTDSDILDYLSRPENIALTFEIAGYMDRLRPRLLKEFWAALRDSIAAAHPANRECGNITVEAPEDVLYEYASIHAWDASNSGKKQWLRWCIQHQLPRGFDREYPFRIGLAWYNELKDESLYEEPLIRKLRDRLCKEGYHCSWQWWPAGRELTSFSKADTLLCEFKTSPDETLAPFVTAFWDLVADTEAEVAEINRLVASR